MLKEINWLKNNFLFNRVKVAGILLIPFILYFVPVDWLDQQHSICLYKNITGNECYGCGMTRAILSSLHFKFLNAFYFNKLFIIVLPLLIYLWGKSLIKQVQMLE
jgi:hypothetical protein